jgi:hypothetical protein
MSMMPNLNKAISDSILRIVHPLFSFIFTDDSHNKYIGSSFSFPSASYRQSRPSVIGVFFVRNGYY